MTRNRCIDTIGIIIALFAGLGVYGIFYLLGLQTLGTIFLIITPIGICMLMFYLINVVPYKSKKIYIPPKPPAKEFDPRESIIFKEIQNPLFCKNCGSEMKKGTKFCTECGKLI